MGIVRSLAVVLLLCPAVGASGGVPQDEDKKRIEELEKQVVELTRRLKAVEDQMGALKKAANPAATEAAAAAMGANEHAASMALKTIASAEADFRTNDRDSNGIHDYWVGDVSGLYRYAVNNREIKLIDKSVADADASPLKGQSLSTLKHDQPLPKAGYLFAAIPKYADKEKTENYHSGTYRNTHRFGFAAYPVEYGKTGRLTLVVSETNTVWKKDLGGKPLELFPEIPAKDDWEKMD
jgi:hypothetical protein